MSEIKLNSIEDAVKDFKEEYGMLPGDVGNVMK